MTGVTFIELLGMALRIEKESIHFYRRAVQLLKDEESIRLTDALAREEEEHYKKIVQLQKTIGDDEISAGKGIQIEIDDQGALFSSPDIAECALPEEILESAIQREKETERLYEKFLGTENLPHHWEKLFVYLKDQEKTHAFRLGAILHRGEN